MSATYNFNVTKLADKPTNHEISQITANKKAYNYKSSCAVKSRKYSVPWSRCNTAIMLRLCGSSNLTTLCHKLCTENVLVEWMEVSFRAQNVSTRPCWVVFRAGLNLVAKI